MKILNKIKKWFTLPYRCKKCGKVFDSKRGLAIHKGKMHK